MLNGSEWRFVADVVSSIDWLSMDDIIMEQTDIPVI